MRAWFQKVVAVSWFLMLTTLWLISATYACTFDIINEGRSKLGQILCFPTVVSYRKSDHLAKLWLFIWKCCITQMAVSLPETAQFSIQNHRWKPMNKLCHLKEAQSVHIRAEAPFSDNTVIEFSKTSDTNLYMFAFIETHVNTSTCLKYPLHHRPDFRFNGDHWDIQWRP